MAQRLVAQRLSLALARCRRSHCGCYATSLFFPSPKWIHSTRIVLTSSETTTAVEPETTTTIKNNNQNDDDKCPEWQNPLHHNNPELEKMFPEDFKEGEEMPLVPLPPMAKEGSNVLAPPHVHELADEIVLLNMMEMKQLMDKIATHFGFDPHTIAMGLGGGGGGGRSRTTSDDENAKEKVVEEKTTFDLKLIGFDAKSKIKVIKEVRAIAGLGLKEAKELVESAPTVIKKDIKKEEAEELQKKLEEVGATMEVV